MAICLCFKTEMLIFNPLLLFLLENKGKIENKNITLACKILPFSVRSLIHLPREVFLQSLPNLTIIADSCLSLEPPQ